MWSKMSAIVKVQAQIKTDNTVFLLNIPILLTEQGVFEPLLDYLLSQSHIKSLPWMNRVAFSCLLFLDYMAANRGLFQIQAFFFKILFNVFCLELSIKLVMICPDFIGCQDPLQM